MKMKFLFRMENVGEKNWKNRKKIVDKYFEIESDPFINKNQSCGYSKSDFDMMLDSLQRNNIEVK
jgi:hypothetical protein